VSTCRGKPTNVGKARVERKRVETWSRLAQLERMDCSSVSEYCRMIQLEVVQGLESMSGMCLRRVTVRVGLDCTHGPEGGLKVVRVVPDDQGLSLGGEAMRSWITLELEVGGTGRTEPKGVPQLRAAQRTPIPETQESPSGGDVATLRRRLELVLGGPPGFTTGAKAEVLADLLREFGTPKVVDAILADWIPQFDTGIEASSSVG